MRALVTGANGFLGRHVVEALLARSIEVRAMVRPAVRLEGLGWPSSVEIFRADLRTSRELKRAFEGVDVLLHLAAVVSGGEDAQFAGTVAGTERLLDAMATSACRRLVLCSSFSVYDYSSTRRTLDEGSPLHRVPDIYARDGYTISKWWQERVARRFAKEHGWDLTVLRPGFIWGRDHGYLAALGTDDPRGELRQRLRPGGDGRARPGPDLERRRRPWRAHLELPLRPPAPERSIGVVSATPPHARYLGGAAGRRHRLPARHESARHPHPASIRIAVQAASL
jgi:nucleoside-diphosphate-sugar epimerase